MLIRLLQFIRGEDGASAAEYALIVGLIAVVIVASLVVFGDALMSVFDSASSQINSAA